jgi:hypothetical protein
VVQDVADLADVAGEVEPDAVVGELAGELVEHAGGGDVDGRAAPSRISAWPVCVTSRVGASSPTVPIEVPGPSPTPKVPVALTGRAMPVWYMPRLDDAQVSTRKISDQLGHSNVSMTQDKYLGRRLTDRQTGRRAQDLLGHPERNSPKGAPEGCQAARQTRANPADLG